MCGQRYTRGSGLTNHLKKKHKFSWPAGHPRFRLDINMHILFTGFHCQSARLSLAVLTSSCILDFVLHVHTQKNHLVWVNTVKFASIKLFELPWIKNSYSLKWRWLVGVIYPATKQKGKCPPPAMDSQTAHQTGALIFASLLFSWWLWFCSAESKIAKLKWAINCCCCCCWW